MKKSLFNAIRHDGGTEEATVMPPAENAENTTDGEVATSEESRHFYM